MLNLDTNTKPLCYNVGNKRGFMKDSKFSTTLGKVLSIVSIVIMSIIVIGLLGLLVYLEFYISKPAFSLIWIPLLPTFALISNRFIEHLVGGKTYGANWIEDAKKGKGVVKHGKHRTQKVLTTFIECVLFALLIARFIVLLPVHKVLAIIGIVCSVIGFISYFAIGVIPTE